MSDLYIDNQRIKQFRDNLVYYRSRLIDNALVLRDRCNSFTWDDNLFDVLKREVLNRHFISINRLASELNGLTKQLDEISDLLQKYFDCGN